MKARLAQIRWRRVLVSLAFAALAAWTIGFLIGLIVKAS